MWEMRRDPACVTESERAKLEQLFTRLPQLRTLYQLRGRFKEIFDTATHRRQASFALTELFLHAIAAFPELDAFLCTYEQWQEQILNYFEAGKTSGVVEGINNKARVVTKRAYGIKSADTLWTRLMLDLNMAGAIVVHTIASIRELVCSFRAVFSTACT